ncbi:MAG: methionine--tRNA ligase [Acidocella sp. 21-58-7]|nr:MAG: methionine--tRNA ligase [Acidocella sp. 21-58-7]
MTKPFYISTPIYYVNGAPHLGHAYTSTAADVLARFKRLDGYDVFFLTGTDEHGQKVESAARAAGVPPQIFTDRVAADFADMAKRMGAIYLGAYEGWYAVRDEAFYDEEETALKPDGTRIAIASGAAVEWVVEPSYFFKLSAFQDKLLDYYEANPGVIAPAAKRNEILSFVKGGLNDLSVSRTSFSWGIPVPGDEAHVMYVWLDALVNYITACGYPDEGNERFKYWPADVHLVGKEIIRFHAVYWPAFLMAAGLPLPKKVFSHGWWTVEGEKMSKSLGNFIDVRPLVDEFGLDAVRFFLLREVPFGGDGDFSRKSLIMRLNVELANDLGNLGQRTLSFIAKNAGGVVPPRGPLTEPDHALLATADALPGKVRDALDRLAFHEAMEDIWKLVRAANAYIDHQAPWALKKTDPDRMNTVLRVLLEAIRTVAILLQPFMPDSMAALLDQLGQPMTDRQIAALETKMTDGAALPAPSGIFPRYVEKVLE